MIRLTDTSPAPSTPLKAPSTAEVQAPQVIPSTLIVVVAMAGSRQVGDNAGSEPRGSADMAISPDGGKQRDYCIEDGDVFGNAFGDVSGMSAAYAQSQRE